LSAANNLLRVMHAHHNIYLDAAWGFSMVKEKIEEMQKLMLRSPQHPAKTIEELDQTTLYISEEDPAEHRVEHVEKMGLLKQRNVVGGCNHIVLRNLVVVSVFSFWEDHYRARIAEELGIPELRVPVIGDIRLIRNDIVHHHGVATPRIEKCQTLCWFKAGDPIIIDAGKLDTMMVEVRIAITSLFPPPTP